MNRLPSVHSRAFTLIELSIVLVIIGLIAGGVMVGKDLVTAASLRAQTKQLQDFEVAFNTFKLKYNCLPGDCNKATQFFSGTVNGNGNDKIDVDADSANVAGENAKFFQQLSLAGLTAASYNGTATFPYGYPAISMYPTMGITSGYAATGTPSQAFHYQLSITSVSPGVAAALYLNISNPSGLSSSAFNDGDGIFTPSDLYQMDSKFDDGLARTGNFRAYKPMGPYSCLTADEGNYLLSATGRTCHAEYILLN